jgi:hypothetical protein
MVSIDVSGLHFVSSNTCAVIFLVVSVIKNCRRRETVEL